ncbi:MAG: hypothetical protein ACKVU1_03685 [bacterium]
MNARPSCARAMERSLAIAHRRAPALAATAAAVLASPLAASACSVCFGADPKSPWAASINGGIYVLLGVTGVVLSCFIALILTIRRRTKLWEARKNALHVVSFSDGAHPAHKA